MRIKIKNKSICEKCTRNTCSMNNVIQKPDFYALKTEQFVCPVRLLKRQILDEQLEKGYIDIPPNNKEHPEECVYCGLCAVQCNQQNLEIINYDYSFNEKNSQLFSEPVGNIIATSYLNCLYDFSANTNIIKPLHFDGYVCSSEDTECFVEIDIDDDSLECCRRLLADIVMHNYNKSKKMSNGLMVLSRFPNEGSRDIFTLIDCIKRFPNTSNLKIFITTFSLLRFFVINHTEKNMPFNELFYSPTDESKEVYTKRLLDKNIITKDIANRMFEP